VNLIQRVKYVRHRTRTV